MTWRGSPQRWWLLALGLLAAVTAAGVAVFTVKYVSRPQPVEIVVASADTGSPVEVYLSGAGAEEGIYTVGQDATLDDILQRAGVVPSGEGSLKIRVIVLGPDDGGSSPTPEEEPSGKININSATAAELDSLSGIGPAKAQAIVDYRDQNGPFRTIDDLLNVPGIGPKILESIRDQITVIG
jgi:competence protein ComEA